jgi:TolA-binding protein
VKIRALIVAAIMAFSFSNTSLTFSQAAPKAKTKTLKIKLPGGGITTVKGTKQQLFKTLTKTEEKIEILEEQIDDLENNENCISIECKNLEKQVKDAEKIKEVITRSLYSQAADASMLSPLTDAELKYFANLVKKEIEQVEKDIKEVDLGKSKEMNEYLSDFENRYLYKAGYEVNFFIQAIKGSLESDLKFLNKVLGGLEWNIANKNPEGTSEINISRRLSIQEKIVSWEENHLENSKIKN